MCIPTPLVAPTPQASLKQVSFGQVYMCWNPCIRVCVCVCICQILSESHDIPTDFIDIAVTAIVGVHCLIYIAS